MPDPSMILERARVVAGRAEPPGDSYDRFIRYRTRRERNRRVTAAVLGLVVASIGVVGALGIAWSIHRGEVGVGPGPTLPSDDSGGRHRLRILNEVTVGAGTFRVVRYRDGRGLYCQDIDFSFASAGRIASAGGCNYHPIHPLRAVINAGWGSAGGPLAQGHVFAYVFGEVRSGIASVRVQWSDGRVTTARPQHRLFLAAREGSVHPTFVVALDANGREVGRKPLGGNCGILGGGHCQGLLDGTGDSLGAMHDSVGIEQPAGQAPVSTTIFLDPLHRLSFAPPGEAQPEMMADEAIAEYEAMNPIFNLPSDARAELGLYTDAPGDGSYLFHDRLAWGFTWHECAPQYPNFRGSPPPEDVVCRAWLFLDANTGQMLELTWQSEG